MLEPGFAFGLLGDLKRFGRVREKMISPLIILRLTELVVLTDGGHRFALEPFKHDDRLRLGVPLPSLHD